MDSRTGDLYESLEAARTAGVRERDLVMVEGSPEAVVRISAAVKAQRRRRNKQARQSRKRNR